MSDTQTSTHISQVGTVMVPVSDQDQAIAFYTEKLGLERFVSSHKFEPATTLALVTPREGEATGIEPRVAFSTTDIDADHADLRARGVDVDDEVMRMGDPVPPMFFMRDHEGNKLLVVQTG